jgi:hypothetical protein
MAVGCGGGSGVDGSKKLSGLTPAERADVCDGVAARNGGYGAVNTCSMTDQHVPATQAECTSNFPACDATVAQLDGCFDALLAATKACTSAALQAAAARADCAALMQAGCFGGGGGGGGGGAQ